MEDEEQKEMIAKDIPKMTALLSGLNEKISDADQRVLSLIERVESGSLCTIKGVSFLEMKFHLLLSYLINMVQLMLFKTNGRSIEGDPVIERLVEIRTVMEKIRPLNEKLKYQIDKLLKIAKSGHSGGKNDPLRFKPKPENLVSKLEDTTEEEKKTGVYVPPKLAAMHYDLNNFLASLFTKMRINFQKEKSAEIARKKALNSSLLRELRDEYSEAPLELKETEIFDRQKEKVQDEEKHQQRYEENNMMRVISKKRGKGIKIQTQSLDELTKFTDLSILTKMAVDEESDDDDETARKTSKKKRKSRSFRKSDNKKKKLKGKTSSIRYT
ncbi:neuroguidin-like [Xenia sp. Carnegie-2017]|uniref:neuroguidin-like n=1 Tax=Xenia sp. Carnegie-2017 TaxID=2897299 RepID=UPI001F03E658|nr:neuroguidin-like [Xenia sp. Carnegie-2017]